MFYELWYAPTLLGQTAFGWKHKLKDIYDAADLEDAHFDCYILNCDEPAPDKYNYGRYILIGPLAG